MIDLSILICSVHTRYKTFGPRIQDQVWTQYASLSPADQDRIEILFLADNKKTMLGEKRNLMVQMAQGRYVQFIDDDDRIEPDMFKTLLDATQSDADAICFQALVSLNGGKPKICYYSKDFGQDFNKPNSYHRIPNHISCVKRELALKAKFPNIVYGEDVGYSKKLLPLLKTEHQIDKVLYHYDYNSKTSEPQSEIKTNRSIVDVVFLSKAETPKIRRMTQAAIDSCLTDGVNVIVIEQTDHTYSNAKTIHRPGKFNFNQFANAGIREGSADWVMVANNDLLFEPGWLSELLAADHPVVCPVNPGDERQKGLSASETGYKNGRHFSGWCFMMKRAIWEQIGGFDECVDFWYSDDVVVEQLKKIKVPPMIVPKARVKHLVSQTLRVQPNKADLTHGQKATFEAFKANISPLNPKINVGVAIVAFHTREKLYTRLQNDLKSMGPGLFVDDGSLGEWKNHARAYQWLFDQGYSHGIVLQDDVLPINKFAEHAINAISLRPEHCISFYTGTGSPGFLQPKVRRAVEEAEAKKLSWLGSKRMVWGPAIAMPSVHIPDFVSRYDGDVYDQWLGRFCTKNKIPVSYTYPSFVDHDDQDSTLWDKHTPDMRKAWSLGPQINPADQREARFWG